MEGYVSHAAYAELRRSLPERDYKANPLLGFGSFMGMRIEPSSQFPATHACSACGGTGEGTTATFCPPCHGAGRIQMDGILRDGAVTQILTTRLPRKAYVRVLFAVAPRPLCRGLV